MLLKLVCYECMVEQMHKVETLKEGIPMLASFEPVNNTGIYEVKCMNGHKNSVVIDNIDFEILFQYGLHAIVDGYYREAVSSITSAMERYFEFFIKAVFYSSKIKFEEIDIIWKKMANQSERQLGSYLSLYLLTFSEEPTLLSNSETSFRNSVIHKGLMPTKEQTIDYGNKILNVINSSLSKLKSKYPEVTSFTFEYYSYIERGIRKNLLSPIMGISSLNSIRVDTLINVKEGLVIDGKLVDKNESIKNIEQGILKVLSQRDPQMLMRFEDPSVDENQ